MCISIDQITPIKQLVLSYVIDVPLFFFQRNDVIKLKTRCQIVLVPKPSRLAYVKVNLCDIHFLGLL